MAKVIGVGGVFFKSQDPIKLCQWYRDVLELDLDDGFNGAVFKKETLPEKAYLVWSPFEQGTDYFRPSEKEYMINLIVDDVEQALLQVKKGGGEIIGETQELEFGVFGWFVDPEGNKIELWKPA